MRDNGPAMGRDKGREALPPAEGDAGQPDAKRDGSGDAGLPDVQKSPMGDCPRSDVGEALSQQVIWDAVADVLFVADLEGRLTFVSPNAAVIFGQTSWNLDQPRSIRDFLPANLGVASDLKSIGDSRRNIGCRIRDALGRDRDLLVSVRRVEVLGEAFLYTCRDVSDRVRLEKELQLLESSLDRQVQKRTGFLEEQVERYRRLVEELPGEYLFFSADPTGILTYISPGCRKILGRSPDEMVGTNWRDVAARTEPTFARVEEIERLHFSGTTVPWFEIALKHIDGTTRWCEVRDFPVRDAAGNVILNEGIVHDVTESRAQRLEVEQQLEGVISSLEQVNDENARLRERLRVAKQRLNSLGLDVPMMVVRCHLRGHLAFANQMFCDFIGKRRQDAQGRPFSDFVSPVDLEKFQGAVAKLGPSHSQVSVEIRLLDSEGMSRWTTWVLRRLEDEEGLTSEYQFTGEDATASMRERSQALVRQQARERLQQLSRREREVMELVVVGHTNKVIARRLELSIKTVEKHRSGVMRRLNVESVAGLVRLAMLSGEFPEAATLENL